MRDVEYADFDFCCPEPLDNEPDRAVRYHKQRVEFAAGVVRAGFENQKPGEDGEVADRFHDLGRPMKRRRTDRAENSAAAAVEEAADTDRTKHAKDVDRGIVKGAAPIHTEGLAEKQHEQRNDEHSAEK